LISGFKRSGYCINGFQSRVNTDQVFSDMSIESLNRTVSDEIRDQLGIAGLASLSPIYLKEGEGRCGVE
jgi:hypothetical protein